MGERSDFINLFYEDKIHMRTLKNEKYLKKNKKK